MTEKNFTPGSLWRTRDGSKARIYAVDGGATSHSIHGAVWIDKVSYWRVVAWTLEGYCGVSDWALDTPWVDPPPKRPRLLAWGRPGASCGGLRLMLYPEDFNPLTTLEAGETIVRLKWLDEKETP